ncbi:MAG TPA: hypothetical protein VG406_29685 [Isosphaeraceae bacterium]|nr:hypothetical protein [Isosphaeraceae bacterium]
MVIDYRTRQAALATAAFLTVVGSPVNGQVDDAQGNPSDNVYVVWISPRAKVYEASDESGSKKKESSLEKLEVGDRVEIQFTGRDASANAGATQNAEMRRKYGRDRTFTGDANAITILPPKRNPRNPTATSDT